MALYAKIEDANHFKIRDSIKPLSKLNGWYPIEREIRAGESLYYDKIQDKILIKFPELEISKPHLEQKMEELEARIVILEAK